MDQPLSRPHGWQSAHEDVIKPITIRAILLLDVDMQEQSFGRIERARAERQPDVGGARPRDRHRTFARDVVRHRASLPATYVICRTLVPVAFCQIRRPLAWVIVLDVRPVRAELFRVPLAET